MTDRRESDSRYNRSEKGRARTRRYDRKRYARVSAAGVCSRCRRREVEDGVGGIFTKCFNCRTEQASYDFMRTDRLRFF